MTPADIATMRALTRGAPLMAHELATRLGVSEGAARARCSRLALCGLVTSTRTSGFAFYQLTPEGVRANRASA